MIEGRVAKSGNDVTVTFGGNHTVTLPENKAKVLVEKGYVGKDVILGIRPEDLHDDAEIVAKNPKSLLTAKVRVYEMLGAEVLLYFDVQDTNFIARVNPTTPARVGDTIKVAMDLNKTHIFDKETEKVICN